MDELNAFLGGDTADPISKMKGPKKYKWGFVTQFFIFPKVKDQ